VQCNLPARLDAELTWPPFFLVRSNTVLPYCLCAKTQELQLQSAINFRHLFFGLRAYFDERKYYVDILSVQNYSNEDKIDDSHRAEMSKRIMENLHNIT
jgi:hypothetical protein